MSASATCSSFKSADGLSRLNSNGLDESNEGAKVGIAQTARVEAGKQRLALGAGDGLRRLAERTIKDAIRGKELNAVIFARLH
jgi:hypothetical protein